MASPAALSRSSLTLVVLTVAGLLAALFAPGGGWAWGADLSAVGASVYAAGVAVLVPQVALKPERILPGGWSVSERRAWAAVMWSEAQHGEPPMTLHMFMFRRFGGNLGVLLGAAAIVNRSLRSRLADDVEIDERDLRIRHAADRAGNTVLTIIMIASVILLATLPAELLEWWLAPLIAAHALIGVLICKSLAENVWLVARYARERR